MSTSLPRIPPDECVSAAAFNALAEAVEPLLCLSASPPLQVHRNSAAVHLSLAGLPQRRLLELTTDFAINQTDGVDDDVPSATARHVHYDRDTNDFAPTTDLADVRVYHVTALPDPLGTPIRTPSAGIGQRVCAGFNAQSGRWEWCGPPPLIRFELDQTLVRGGSAVATEVVWNGVTWVAIGAVLTVYDSIFTFTGSPGCRGLAGYWGDSRRWEIIHMADCEGLPPGSSSSGSSSSSS